ncbi:MAG: hypothetical protein WAW07_13440 [Bacteroidales bacterium]
MECKRIESPAREKRYTSFSQSPLQSAGIKRVVFFENPKVPLMFHWFIILLPSVMVTPVELSLSNAIIFSDVPSLFRSSYCQK